MARILISASFAALIFATANGLAMAPVEPGNDGCSSAVLNCMNGGAVKCSFLDHDVSGILRMECSCDCLEPFVGAFCEHIQSPCSDTTSGPTTTTTQPTTTTTTQPTTTTTRPTTTTTQPTSTTEEQLLAGNPGILVADQTMHDVVFFDIATNISTRLNLSGLYFPNDVAVDPVEGYLFIGNRGSESSRLAGYIVRTRLDGSESEVIADRSIAPQPMRLALDPNYQHVYFTDMSRNQIVSIDYDGNSEIYSISVNENPIGLVLDLTQGLVYWSFWNGGLYVASMNNSTITTIRENGYYGVTSGIDLDTSGTTIYLCEYYYAYKGVETWNVNGSAGVGISNGRLGMMELVLYGDYIFVVSLELPHIEVMPKSGGLLERLGESNYLSSPHGMTLYAP